MDEIITIALIALSVLAVIAVLPIIALVRTSKIRLLEQRIEGLEAALLRVMREGAAARPQQAAKPAPEPAVRPSAPPPISAAASGGTPRPAWQTETLSQGQATVSRDRLEEIIGERWLGWVGVAVLLFGAAFGLKYAFENRWIGELGRVAMGVTAGAFFVWLGWQRHRAGWKHLSQALTAGGVTLLYLSIYAAYGFYDLIAPTAAFLLLVLIVAQAHALAVLYGSWPVALWGQIGGFLTPLLLSTGEDRYWVLFPYLTLLCAGAVAVCLVREWHWVASVSLALTHAVFWAWYDEHYHPDKLWPAIAFQVALFGLFAAADLAAAKNRGLAAENWIRIYANPVAFFTAAYVLLEPRYPAWMGAMALLVALLYAVAGRWSHQHGQSGREPALAAAGVSLIFITAAIPIQLEANWITFAWGAQAAILAWLAGRLDSPRLRLGSALIFALALSRHLISDIPWGWRYDFTPLLNEYFLTALALSIFLVAAAQILKEEAQALALGYAFAAIVLTWFTVTMETDRYADLLVRELPSSDYEARRTIERAGSMAISVLWSCYAAALVVGGLRFRLPLLRWSGLALFGLTLLKAAFVDIPSLDGFYRFAALIALGLLLIVAAWGYQRLARAEAAEGDAK